MGSHRVEHNWSDLAAAAAAAAANFEAKENLVQVHGGWRAQKMDKRPESPDLGKSGSSQPEGHGRDAKAAVTSPAAASLNDF